MKEPEPNVFIYADLIEANRKTVRANNPEIQHQIPVGSLVEVDLYENLGDGGFIKGVARLWVGKHTRDCDGTPLYTLVENLWASRQTWIDQFVTATVAGARSGYSEESLKLIEGPKQ